MEQFVKGRDGELIGEDWEWLNQNGRAIALDYAIHPRVRNLQESAGGKEVQNYLRRDFTKYKDLLSDIRGDLLEFFQSVPRSGDPAGIDPFWDNGWFPPLDAIAICSLIYKYRPQRYIEVGSGNSTKFAKKLIESFNLDVQIVSIDPEPRADIDKLCDRVLRFPLEDAPGSFFNELAPEDAFFLDSSHRSFQNSDVTVFFTEILPGFPSNMLYGIHDIVLPRDYEPGFLPRFYNEQYLLACYIIGGSADDVEFPCAYVAYRKDEIPDVFQLADQLSLDATDMWGSSFWARKRYHHRETMQHAPDSPVLI